MLQLPTSVLLPSAVAVVMFLAALLLAMRLKRERAAERERRLAEERYALERFKRELARRTEEQEERHASAPEPYRRRVTGASSELPAGPYSDENPVPGLSTGGGEKPAQPEASSSDEEGPAHPAAPGDEETDEAVSRHTEGEAKPDLRIHRGKRRGKRASRRAREESGSTPDGPSGGDVADRRHGPQDSVWIPPRTE